jgi:phospholipase C
VTAPVGEPSSYHPVPANNVMPAQEPGTKPARPLPYQPNASLAGFTFGANGAVTANLALSNSAPHARKSSHFAVYNNAAPDVNIADYPGSFPGQYTVPPARQDKHHGVTAATEIGNGAYDLTVTGPNRFLRRFTGNVAAPGATAKVTASYYGNGWDPRPALLLELANEGTGEVTFTVTPNHYSGDKPSRYTVRPGHSVTHQADPVRTSGGWYDLTVTLEGDASWSQRFTGHLETGGNSVTG